MKLIPRLASFRQSLSQEEFAAPPGADRIEISGDNWPATQDDVLSISQRVRLSYIVSMSTLEATKGGEQHPLWQVVTDGEALLNGQSTELVGTPAEVFEQLDALFILHSDGPK